MIDVRVNALKEYITNIKEKHPSKLKFFFEIILIIIFSLFVYLGINSGISEADMRLLIGFGGVTLSGGIFGFREIALKIKDQIDYKNIPMVLENIANKLEGVAGRAKNQDDLDSIDEKTDCLYDAFTAYLLEKDVMEILRSCDLDPY